MFNHKTESIHSGVTKVSLNYPVFVIFNRQSVQHLIVYTPLLFQLDNRSF